MADVSAALKDWSSTSASNSPAGGTTIGTGLDDNLREIQGAIVRGLSHKGSDIASATTTDLGAVEGLAHDITGSTTITSFGTVRAGIWKVIKFEGAPIVTHNATSLILPNGINIQTAAGDVMLVASEGSGNWRCIAYQSITGTNSVPAVATVAAHATTMNPWVARQITASGGAVTFTDIADAPYVGAITSIYMNAAHVWTDGAVFNVQGNANYTATIGDWVDIYATTVSTFDVFVRKANGTGVGSVVLGTEQASTSGTSKDFTIAAGAKEVTITLEGVSLDAATEIAFQIGDAGGIETSGYLGYSAQIASTVSVANPTTMWRGNSSTAAAVYHGTVTLTLKDAANFTWACSGNIGRSDTSAGELFAGTKSLTAELTTVRVTSGNGTANFDAGSINVLVKY